MPKQRQIICPIIILMTLSNFGAKLEEIEYGMTHRSKCAEMF